MKRNVILLITVACLTLLFAGPLLAQDRATMSAPIIRSSGEDVVFTVRFEKFAAGRVYRVGFGVKSDKAIDAKVELLKGDSPVSVAPSDFEQGNASGWWGLDKVMSKGFVLEPAQLPPAGENLVFRVTAPRDALEQFEKVYIFVSRDYGSSRWYLEDGSEIDSSDW